MSSTKAGCSYLQVVVTDLSETCRAIARRYFPNAAIVADGFHVVRLIKQHFLKVRLTQKIAVI